jgi:lipopolysaccharide export system permease protein
MLNQNHITVEKQPDTRPTRPLIPWVLTGYIVREIITFFSICLVTFVGILLTIRMLRLTALVVNKGVLFSQVASVLIAIIPTFFEIALPLATLIGIMLAFARLSGDSELIVLKGSGVPFSFFTIPVAIIGISVATLGFVTSSYLKPWGFSTLARTFFEIARTKTTAGVQEGVFNKLGVITLYADSINDENGELTSVLLDDRREESSRKVITATHGRIIPDNSIEAIVFLLEKGEIHEFVGDKYVVTRYDSNRLILDPSQLSSADASQKGASARELYPDELTSSIAEFKDYISYLEGPDEKSLLDGPRLSPLFEKQMHAQPRDVPYLKKKLSRLYLEQLSRVSLPVGTLLLALLSLPLGIHPPRSHKTWGAGLSIAIGMLVFIVYYGFFTLGLGLAEGGWLPPILAVWLPNVLILILDVWFLRMLMLERWTSVASGLGSLFSRK